MMQKRKNTKLQRITHNKQIVNEIRFCIFVKSCKNAQKSPKKGDFSGKNKPFEAQNPTFQGGILCFYRCYIVMLKFAVKREQSQACLAMPSVSKLNKS